MATSADKPKKSISASISNVGQPLSKDQSSRARKYFISMMIRTLCFVLAVLLPNPYRWIALFGAVILPYIAVVVANAGRETIKGSSATFTNKTKEIGAE